MTGQSRRVIAREKGRRETSRRSRKGTHRVGGLGDAVHAPRGLFLGEDDCRARDGRARGQIRVAEEGARHPAVGWQP